MKFKLNTLLILQNFKIFHNLLSSTETCCYTSTNSNFILVQVISLKYFCAILLFHITSEKETQISCTFKMIHIYSKRLFYFLEIFVYYLAFTNVYYICMYKKFSVILSKIWILFCSYIYVSKSKARIYHLFYILYKMYIQY